MKNVILLICPVEVNIVMKRKNAAPNSGLEEPSVGIKLPLVLMGLYFCRNYGICGINGMGGREEGVWQKNTGTPFSRIL